MNIAFFTALADSGEDAAGLMQMSSTTFRTQFEIARTIAQENPTAPPCGAAVFGTTGS